MELPLFEQVADALQGLLSDDVGPWRYRAHRRGIKVWFGGEKPSRTHYEAQVIPRRYVDGTDGAAIEVGFHAEHPDEAVNQACLERLTAAASTWRSALGDAAETGPFLGNDGWRRLSETWVDPDLDDDDELAFELASRLTDYIEVVEPILAGDDS